MKRLRKIISLIMVLLILSSNLQLPYLKSDNSPQVYAESDSNILLSDDATIGTVLSTVTDMVYYESDDIITDSEAVELDEAWLTDELLLSGNSNLSSVTENVYLPENGPNGSTISWESTDELVVSYDGTVIRPSHTEEDREVTLTATISMGYAENKKIFTVIVKAMESPHTALAVKYDDFSDIGNSLEFNGGATLVYESAPYAYASAPCEYTSAPYEYASDSDGEDTDYMVARLTASENEGGNFFTKKPIYLSDNMSFSTYFEFMIQSNGEWAEGFTFTLQSAGSDVFINHGPSMGTFGIKPSLSIELDTMPQEDPSEIPSQHTAVFINGDYDSPEALVSLPYNISEGQMPYPYHVWIEYDGTSKVLEMRINDIDYRPTEATMTKNNLNLGDVFTTEEGSRINEIYVGFTANTNENSAQEHYIRKWYFKNDSIPIESFENVYVDAASVELVSEPVLGQASSKIEATLYEKGLYPAPVAGVPIYFSTSFGSLNATSVITDQNGKASVSLSSGSDPSGSAVVKAIAQGGAFTTTEVQLENPVGDVIADKAWLTDGLVLNGNSTLDNVIVNLAMPQVGQYGSIINWESSDEDVIALDGTVTRPSYMEGDKEIALTATISKGDSEEEKSFIVIVKAMYQTDAEALAKDLEWLTVFRTLGVNYSQNSITDNLILPPLAPNGSSIIWESSMPTVISNRGVVYRPEYPNHKSVDITATLKKGDEQESKQFTYTVLAETDIEPPYVIDTKPKDNSEAVVYDNREISVTFNENIKQGTDWNEIKVGYLELIRTGTQAWEQKLIEVESFVRIDNNKLIVNLNSDMKSLRTYKLIIPQKAITDSSNNNLSREVTLGYKVEKIETGVLQVVDSNPSHGQENVSAQMDCIVFSYGDIEILEGNTFNDISLCNRLNEVIPISREMNGNTVTLKLEPGTELQLGEVYRIDIPAGAVQDRFKRNNNSETIQFKTKAEDVSPEIINIYPGNNKCGVNVNQSVDISFSEQILVDYAAILLLDEKGNRVPANTFLYNDNKEMIIDPVKALKPKTTYTVFLPKNSIWDYSSNYLESQYEMFFTTGSNLLNMDFTNISDTEREVDLFRPILIQFSSPVIRGPEYGEIKLSDSQGNTVTFHTEETDNSVILYPDADFVASETYTLYIPGGAYTNKNNDINDMYQLRFTTASPIENKASFLVKPSSYYFINNTLVFDSGWIENIFKNMGREITSYEWTFGDGTKQNGKIGEHIYTEVGDYLAALKITDSKGISYEYNETVTIMENYNDADISVSPWENKRVLKSNDSTKDITSYEINASYQGIPLTGVKIRVRLYENNNKVYKDFGEIITDIDGKAIFNLNYHNLTGMHELVFLYRETGEEKEIRCPINIYEMREDLSLWIGLREGMGRNESSFNWPSINVEVDGKSKIAERSGMGYKISGISSGTHEIQVFTESFYPSDKKVLTMFEDKITYMILKRKILSETPIINYITSEWTDSRDSDDKIFINSNPKYFTVYGDWNGHKPGYLEYKSVVGIPGKTFTREVFDADTDYNILLPNQLFLPGGRLTVRMVSEDGVASQWVDAKFEVAPPFTSSENSMSISGFISGKIPVLEKIPLMDGDKIFSFNGGSYGLYPPKEYGNCRQILVFYKSGEVYNSAAVEIGGFAGGHLIYQYYPDLDDWRLAEGSAFVFATGTRRIRKTYDIPGLSKIKGIKLLKIKGYAELTTTANIGGTLIIECDSSGEKDYKGILYFAPEVGIVVGAGSNQVHIEGYGNGRIETQVHLPTKYIQVDPSVEVGIRAKCFCFEGTIYSVEAETSWNNGKEKISVLKANNTLEPLMVELDTDDFEFTPMPRDYLNQPSEWMAASNEKVEETLFVAREISPLMISEVLSYDKFAVDETNPQVETMKDNIYPDAEVQLVRNGDELWMIWTDDNPERSSVNRTQLMYSIFKDGNWSEPEWMGQDGTADFNPVSASTGNGVLVAWQNMKKTMPEDAEINDFIMNSEISVTESVYKAGSSDVQIVTLTDDDKFDHSPKLSANGENALLVWTKSEGMELSDIEATENSDSLVFSKWNGSKWREPEEIANSLPTIIDSSIAMNGNEGLLLYTLAIPVGDDEENYVMFARIYNGNSWTEAVKIAENQGLISNPQAVYYNDEWFLTWYENESIMYREDLNGETKTSDFLSKVDPNYDMIVNEGENPQIALVYKQGGRNSVQTLSTSFYDIEKGIWSDEIPLTEGEGYTRSVSPTFTKDGKLNVAYTQAEIIIEVIEGVELKKPSNVVDLRMLNYTPVHDLALDENDGLHLSYGNPVQGTTVKVTATIRNKGDFAEDATLHLYDGNPEEGSRKIGEASTTQPIPARSSTQVEVEWVVGLEEREGYNIYAVVDPDDDISEVNENNNTIKHEIVSADIAITDLECENIGRDDYMVTAIVANKGSRLLEGIKVNLYHDLSMEPLETKNLEQLEPGQEVSLTFILSSDGLTKDENGEINMTVNALLPQGIDEFSTENNVYAFELERTPIVVDSMEPLNGGTQIDIIAPLTLGFNMNVEQGEKFDQIVLKDDFLNAIDISKTLEDNTLTVTPQTPMDYNTRYTLTIPREAIGDSYGHMMNSSYSLSFVTTTSSPEIDFVYPGDGMGNVALDTDIKMQFNQDVLEGPTFDEVVLYGPGSEEISASVSLQGEWLYVNPTENLDQNTLYSFLIPFGAVQNDMGEVLQDDYWLEFSTGQAMENGTDDNDSGNSGHEHSSKVSDVDQSFYRITRQTLEDGSGMAIVDIDKQSILKLKSADRVEVIINVTDAVKEDEIIRVNLTESAVKQLLTDKLGFNIVTGKGDVRLPAELIKSFAGKGENPITITIVEKDEMENDNERVSSLFDFSITVGNHQVTEFEPEVIVTIPIQIAGVGNAKRVIAYVYDKDKDSWQPAGGVANETEGTITFKARYFSTFAAFKNVKHFDDVTSDWAKEKVEILASRGLINGKTDNEFDPEDSITRAEFTALIVRSLYTEPLGSKGTFTDVPEDAWFADTVETAYEMGFVDGIGHSRFDPDSQISREQLATIVYRLYQYKTGTETKDKMSNTFIDRDDISSYAEEAVSFIANTEIMIGSGGRFEPKRSATRQETAVVLYRLLEYMGEL